MSSELIHDQLLYDLRYNPSLRYEAASGQFDTLSSEEDLGWITRVHKTLASNRNPFSSSLNATAIAYGAAMLAISTQAIDPLNPLSLVTNPGQLTWTGPTPGTSAARLAAEVAAVSAIQPFGGLLAQAIQEQFNLNPLVSLANYVDLITAPALYAFAELVMNLNDGVLVDRGLALRDAILALPRATYGARPLYTVAVDDTLESIAENIFGSADRWGDIISTYRLYPPYLSTDGRNGTLSPGSRVVLSNDTQSFAEEEAYGVGWMIDVDHGVHTDEYDIVANDSSGIAEVSGLNAVATDLAMRMSQPADDWEHDYDPQYGVPDLTGQNGSTLQNFGLAAAMTADPRVATAYIGDSVPTNSHGLVINDVVIILKTPSRAEV